VSGTGRSVDMAVQSSRHSFNILSVRPSVRQSVSHGIVIDQLRNKYITANKELDRLIALIVWPVDQMKGNRYNHNRRRPAEEEAENGGNESVSHCS
jgi:hypothetical protein